LLHTQLRFESLGYLECVIAHCFDVQTQSKRQKVLERIEAQSVRDQGGPLGFHIQQFWGHRLGKQSRQWPKRRGLTPLAVTMLEPRTGELTGAEQGAKRAAAMSLELERCATVQACRMGVEKGADLLLEEVALEGAQDKPRHNPLYEFGE
jgi:hypothetical protein